MSAKDVRRVALASGVGTTIEWYDFFIYGTAAGLVFNELFFPSFDPLVGTLLSFATFSVGFIARPIGGVIFGHFGDRIGRKSMLVITLSMMGLTTLGIGLLPTYDVLGVAAPILLVMLRFVQGISLGGELGGAVLMTIEHAPEHRRGFYGSWVNLGVPAGLILGNVAFLVMNAFLSPEMFVAWGWRIPFWIGGLFVLVGLIIRLKVTESPNFKALKEQHAVARTPILEVLRTHPVQMLLVCGSYFAIGVSFYGATVFGLSYGADSAGYTDGQMLSIELISMVAVFIAIPIFGHLSDRFNRKVVFQAGCVWMLLMAFPWFWLTNSGSIVLAGLGFVLLILGYAAAAGALPAFYAEAFDDRIRYTGFSFAYTAGTMLVGGITPVLATSLLSSTGSWVPVAVFMVVMSLVAVVCVAIMRDPYRRVVSGTAEGRPHVATKGTR